MLTGSQMTEYERRLEREYARLLDEINTELTHSDNEAYIDVAGKVHDTGDESVADLLADLNIMALDRHINEIRAIENALQRITIGSYGTCVDCRQPIPPERLDVQLTTERCAECQTRYEKTHAGKRPSL